MTLNVPQDFLSHGEADWLAAVEKALKGAPFERLVRRSEEGAPIAPLYAGRRDVSSQQLRPAQVPWTMVQRIDIPDPVAANRQIHEDLQGGADGLDLVFATSQGANDGQGLQVEGLADFERLLEGVYLDLVKLRISGGYAGTAFLAMLAAYLDKQHVDPAKVEVNLGADPVSALLVRGRLNKPIEEFWRRGIDVIHALEKDRMRACFFSADGRIWHRGGAGQAEELAGVMASALAFLRALSESAVPPEAWSRHVSVTLVAEADQLGTLAKARAARRIWASILDACGLDQVPLKLHMQTSYRMLTNVDPWVNLLRNTVAAFAAGVGGADSITVLPHTKSLGLPDAFARRLARNTQSILLEESGLHMVCDPSAGSGAIEARTEMLTGEAWKLLQEMEAEGGVVAALAKGSIQAKIRKTAEERSRAVATRKRPITGVSEFPLLSEKPVNVLPSAAEELEGLVETPVDLGAPGEGQRFGDMKAAFLRGDGLSHMLPHAFSADPAVVAEPLAMARLSEPYERLRERASTAVGGMPGVFLACLGRLSEFTARATWVSNALATGGIASIGGEPAADLAALVAAFRETGAKTACLVASDRLYEEQGEEAAKALKEAGVEFLYLAGKPADNEAALRTAGVDGFIYAGCDLLQLLQDAQVRAGLGGNEEMSA